MLNEASRQRAADLLIEAERTGVPTTQLDQAFPGIEIDDAYAIQQRIIACLLYTSDAADE